MLFFAIFIYVAMFLIFCAGIYLQYKQHQHRVKVIRQNKEKSLAAIQQYRDSQQSQVPAQYQKEQLQKLKQQQLERDLRADYLKQTTDDATHNTDD
tara:strand:- start:2006 stop:2293 length:288 start_codon:yes stop_codon:yes gene_type:complete